MLNLFQHRNHLPPPRPFRLCKNEQQHKVPTGVTTEEQSELGFSLGTDDPGAWKGLSGVERFYP